MRQVTSIMGNTNSKLFIVKADFVLYKQNKSDGVQGVLNAIHLCEVDKNHDIKKSTVFYPSNKAQQNVIKRDREVDPDSLTWGCLVCEEGNNQIRVALEDAGVVIVSDKLTLNLIQQLVVDKKENINFIVLP